jgi:Fe-S-cluster containining protein
LDKGEDVSEEKEAFLEWFNDVIPETRFPQIAAQVLFECMNCNECCRGEGYALVDHEDLEEIARSLGLSVSGAEARFTDPHPEEGAGYRVLKNIGPERYCCFLDTKAHRCTIFESRPRICRTFPMLNPDPECGEVICFYPDCRGTARFADMLREKSRDPDVQKEILRLQKDARRLDELKIMQFVWLQKMTGKTEEADEICRITGIKPPSLDNAFKRDCLAYFLMTIATDGLEEYEYEGPERMD